MVQPKIVGPGLGEAIHAASNRVLIKVAYGDGVGCSVVEYSVAPHFVAPPVPHANTREDHVIYVLDGEVLFEFGDRRETIRAGSTLTIPRGVKFVWRNERDEPARLLMIFTPAGFEAYFREVAEVLASLPTDAPPDPASYMPAITGLWSKYGVE